MKCEVYLIGFTAGKLERRAYARLAKIPILGRVVRAQELNESTDVHVIVVVEMTKPTVQFKHREFSFVGFICDKNRSGNAYFLSLSKKVSNSTLILQHNAFLYRIEK